MGAPFVNYEYMREMLVSTMLCEAMRMIYVADHDVFGGETPDYIEGEMFQCGFKPIMVSEQPSFTGVALNYDAVVRLPHEIATILQQRDRIRIQIDGSLNDYEIVGDVTNSRFTTVLEMSRVQY